MSYSFYTYTYETMTETEPQQTSPNLRAFSRNLSSRCSTLTTETNTTASTSIKAPATLPEQTKTTKPTKEASYISPSLTRALPKQCMDDISLECCGVSIPIEKKETINYYENYHGFSKKGKVQLFQGHRQTTYSLSEYVKPIQKDCVPCLLSIMASQD